MKKDNQASFKNQVRKKTIALLFILSLITIPTLLWIFDFERKQTNLIETTEIMSGQIDIIFEDSIMHQINTVEIFQNNWNVTNNESLLFDENRFYNLAPSYYNSLDNAIGISWINGSGIIKWVYPSVENNPAIGQSVFYTPQNESNEAFIYAYNTKQIGMYYSKELFRGGEGYAIYYPLLYQNNLTGFFALIFRFSEFCEGIITKIPFLSDHYIQIYEQDKLMFNSHPNESFSSKYTIHQTISFYNNEWELLLVPSKDLVNNVSPLSSWPLLLLGLFIGGLGIALFIVQNKFTNDLKNEYNEKQMIEKELFESQKMEALGTLAGGIVHESNNVLMGFQGYVSLVETNLKDLKTQITNPKINKNLEENIEYIQEIYESINRAQNLNRQILQFSRHDLIQKEVIHVQDKLSNILSIFEKTIDKRINIEKIFPKSSLYLNLDTNLFQQIIMNLLINARDAIMDGGVIKCQLKKYRGEIPFNNTRLDWIIIKISDTGIGMSQNILDHAFDPFFTTKGKKEGTGLGLSIVYRAMKKMDGYIQIDSENMKGTTITLYFPQEKIKEFPKDQKLPIQKEIRDIYPDLKVFIVEDEIMVVASLTKYLLKLKIGVHASTDTYDVVKDFSENYEQYQLAILDINLPNQNGIEIYKKFHEINPKLKVIFITGYSEYKIDQDDENIIGILLKPFKFTEILSIFRQHFTEYRQTLV